MRKRHQDSYIGTVIGWTVSSTDFCSTKPVTTNYGQQFSRFWLSLMARHVSNERGFNQNKEILDTNMGKDTVTALRIATESESRRRTDQRENY